MSNSGRVLIFLLITLVGGCTFLFLRDYGYAYNWTSPIDSTIFSEWGGFVSGIMASSAFVFTYIIFKRQQKESEERQADDRESRLKAEFEARFFKMIENLQFLVRQLSLHVPLKTIVENGEIVNRDGNDNLNMLLVADADNKIINRVFDNRPSYLTGREVVNVLLRRLLKDLPATTIEDIWEEDQTDADRQKLRYDEFYDKYFYLLSHYFRFMFNLLLFVDEREGLSSSEKHSYINLLQAQVSSDEMGLIFYNAVFNEKAKQKETGVAKFHMLLDKYKFLQNIDDRSILKVEHKKKYYPQTFSGS